MDWPTTADDVLCFAKGNVFQGISHLVLHVLRQVTHVGNVRALSEPTCQTSSQQSPPRGSSPRSPGCSTFAFSLVYDKNSYKSIVEVPKVNQRHIALKIRFSILVERTFLTLSIGIAPPSRIGSYWLLQVDLYESPALL